MRANCEPTITLAGSLRPCGTNLNPLTGMEPVVSPIHFNATTKRTEMNEFARMMSMAGVRALDALEQNQVYRRTKFSSPQPILSNTVPIWIM